MIDKSLFVKTHEKDILVVQVYIDDILFSVTNKILCKEFSNIMRKEFEMNIMEELTFSMALQLEQEKSDTFFCQGKCNGDLLKKYTIDQCKIIKIVVNCDFKFIIKFIKYSYINFVGYKNI